MVAGELSRVRVGGAENNCCNSLHSVYTSLIESLHGCAGMKKFLDQFALTPMQRIDFEGFIFTQAKKMLPGYNGGMWRTKKIGNVSGSCPISPTVRMSNFNSTAITVSTTMVTKGDGMILPIFGRYGNR